jgi:hypothetical protein
MPNGRRRGRARISSAGSGTDRRVLARDTAAYVPADQERQPAEHSLLGLLLPGRCQDRPDPVSQALIEGYDRSCSPVTADGCVSAAGIMLSDRNYLVSQPFCCANGLL